MASFDYGFSKREINLFLRMSSPSFSSSLSLNHALSFPEGTSFPKNWGQVTNHETNNLIEKDDKLRQSVITLQNISKFKSWLITKYCLKFLSIPRVTINYSW